MLKIMVEREVMRYKNCFRDRLLERIDLLTSKVVLWSDIKELGSPRQLSRALNDLMADGRLVRIGRGIYAKAKSSKYIAEPIIEDGFEQACIETLDRLNVKWELGQALQDYNQGRSQQVPAQLELRLKNRFRRKLAYGNNQIRL